MSRATALALLCTFVSGCAYSIVDADGIEPSALDDILSRTTAARGLSAPSPLPVKVISADQVADVAQTARDAVWTEEEIARANAAMITIGLWPAEADLDAERSRLLAQAVAGLYNPRTRTLYVVSDRRAPVSLRLLSSFLRRDFEAEFVLSHEIVHAIQHHHFPSLFDDAVQWKQQTDAQFGIQIALEGDASLFGLQTLLPGGSLPETDNWQNAIDEEVDALDVPLFLRRTAAAPYSLGYALSRREGAELLRDPPASSEQATHEEKRWESFEVFDLETIVDALPEGCDETWRDTLGEQVIGILLGELDPAVARDAWNGWDGDRILVATCDGQGEFLWLSSWDDHAEGTEFAAAYEAVAREVQRRNSYASPPVVRTSGRHVAIASPRLAQLAGDLFTVRQQRVHSLAGLAHFYGLAWNATPRDELDEADDGE